MTTWPGRVPLVAVLLLVPATALALTLDSFIHPFPPNECLPNTAQPILFIGPYCDGASCPPDPLAPCWVNDVEQYGIAGALPGHPVPVYRGASVYTNDEAPAQARVRPESGRLEVEVDDDTYHGVHLTYAGTATQDLGLDLTASGALVFELTGDPTPDHPLAISVVLITARQVGGGTTYATANYSGTLDHAGLWVLPLSAFYAGSEFSWAEVDFVVIELSGDRNTAGAGDLPGRAWALGGLGFATGPTASARKTWGDLKARYR